MVGTGIAQGVTQVGEVLDVPALIGGDGHAVGILLDRGPDHIGDAAVVPEVDHLGALCLQDAPHDRDGCVVAVEEARRCDEAQGPIAHAASPCPARCPPD